MVMAEQVRGKGGVLINVRSSIRIENVAAFRPHKNKVWGGFAVHGDDAARDVTVALRNDGFGCHESFCISD